MTEVTVRVGSTTVTVTALTQEEERAIPEVARKMGTLVGYDHYYYSDVAWEIAEGTPEDVLGDTELARMSEKLGIAEDTDEWDAMCGILGTRGKGTRRTHIRERRLGIRRVGGYENG